MSGSTAKLSFCVAATGSDLRLIVRLDDEVLYDHYPTIESIYVEREFADHGDRVHLLSWEMQGKLPEHTEISPSGAILRDRHITVTDMAFDNIQLGHVFSQTTSYHHDTNGTTGVITQPFYGVMGCNGRAEMRFSTPIYLWLLENM